METKYIKSFDEITGIKGEKTILTEWINNIYVLVTKEKQYFNVYFIDQRFKTEPLNNLYEQIPIKNKPKDLLFYLDLRTTEWNLWFKYNKTFCIEFEDQPE